MCRLSAIKTCSSWMFWPLKMGPIGYPKAWPNWITTLCCVQCQKRAGLKSCSITECLSIRRMSNGRICVLWHNLRKYCQAVELHMISQVKGLVLLSLINIIIVGSKVPSSLKTPKWDFLFLTPHKQNSQTQMNQLAGTAKILSQPGIQLCVASVAVHSLQTDFHGLYERLPWLVQY